MDVPEPVVPLAQRIHEPVDAVPGQAEDGVEAPLDEPVDQDVGGGAVVGHAAPPAVCAAAQCFSRRVPIAAATPAATTAKVMAPARDAVTVATAVSSVRPFSGGTTVVPCCPSRIAIARTSARC